MPSHHHLSAAEIRAMQRSLNFFSAKFLKGLGPIIVDGQLGPTTNHRIRVAKWHLGYAQPLDVKPTVGFRRRLRQPKNPRWAAPAAIARGVARRRTQRRSWLRNLQAATNVAGVGTFDGVPVARWMIPYFEWARFEWKPASGRRWIGRVISGFRDPAHSRDICIAMCGAPSCPGRCAGLASNHVGSVKPKGAGDVTDWDAFAEAMRACPLEPKIFNALAPADPNHFSASGR